MAFVSSLAHSLEKGKWVEWKEQDEGKGRGAKEKDSLCWSLYKQAQQVSASAFNTGD